MNNIGKIRTFLIFIIFIVFYGILIFNLYMIQIVNHNYYSDLADSQHNITTTIIPERALIYDRNNNPLVMNKESCSAFILPNKMEQPKEVKTFLKKHFPKSLARLNESKNKLFMYVKRKLNDQELDLIKKSNLIDIKILNEPSRFYPFEYLGTIIGITDIDNNGLFGIEKEFNHLLSGSPTTFILDQDARSGHFYFKKKVAVSGKESIPVTLTIDKDLQFLASEELKESVAKFNSKEGGVIILNPDNGHILSMVSYPNFNPNDTNDIDLELTKNTPITNAYELGSVMKVFVAIAAFQEKAVKPDELIDCENVTSTKVDGMPFTTVKPNGIISFSEVVEKSNNIGMVKVAKRINKKLYDHYIKFNFGKKTNIPLTGEHSGFVNHPKNWSKRSIISFSFGYELTSTLLQLARAFSIIANDGYDIVPKLTIDKKPNLKSTNPLYSKETMDEIKKILQNTVNKGTAKRAQIQGYTIMGKTGTANLAIEGAYSTLKNIYTFVGIIQKNDYKRIIAVYLKESNRENLRASTIAAPLFEQIAEKMLIYDKML